MLTVGNEDARRRRQAFVPRRHRGGRFAPFDFAGAAAAAGHWVCFGWGREGMGMGSWGWGWSREPGAGGRAREVSGRRPAVVGFCRPPEGRQRPEPEREAAAFSTLAGGFTDEEPSSAYVQSITAQNLGGLRLTGFGPHGVQAHPFSYCFGWAQDMICVPDFPL